MKLQDIVDNKIYKQEGLSVYLTEATRRRLRLPLQKWIIRRWKNKVITTSNGYQELIRMPALISVINNDNSFLVYLLPNDTLTVEVI